MFLVGVSLSWEWEVFQQLIFGKRKSLEVFLVILELGLGLGISVLSACGIERFGNDGGTAEEDTNLAALVFLGLLLVDGVDIRTTVVSTSLETGHSVATVSANLLVGRGGLTSEEEIDGEEITVAFEVLQKINEPFEGSAIAVGPVKLDRLDLGGTSFNLVLDGFKNGSEGGDTNTSGPEVHVLEFDDVLRSSAEGSIDEQDGFTVGSVHHVLLHHTKLFLGVHKVVERTSPISSATNVN